MFSRFFTTNILKKKLWKSLNLPESAQILQRIFEEIRDIVFMQHMATIMQHQIHFTRQNAILFDGDLFVEVDQIDFLAK